MKVKSEDILQALKDRHDKLSQQDFSKADIVPGIAYDLGRADGLLEAISIAVLSGGNDVREA